MIQFVGLDVHKKVIEACLLDEEGRIIRRDRFDCNQKAIEQFARERLQSQDRVALEATTNTWGVVGLLKPFVAKVVISNPLRTKAIAQAKVKTDRVDALVLAQLLRCDYLPDVWEPDEKTQRLRHLTSRKGSLAHQQTAIKNRIHSVLHERLIAAPFTDLYGTIGMNWLKSLPLDEGGRATIDSELRLLKGVQGEIALLDQSLYEKGYCDPRVKLLITLPGVDVNVAQTLLAVFGELSRFVTV